MAVLFWAFSGEALISCMRRILFLFVLCGLVMSSGSTLAAPDAMNAVAERYAHLVLALGQHDPDYVDAFYGPVEWKTNAEKEKKSLDQIFAEAAKLIVDRTFAARALVDSSEPKKLSVDRTAAPLVESSRSTE